MAADEDAPGSVTALAVPNLRFKRRVLFICGSINQTSQMHQIARELPEMEAHFTPYYCDGGLELMRRAGMLGFTILGASWRRDCVDYLEREGLPIDLNGAQGPYDLVL